MQVDKHQTLPQDTDEIQRCTLFCTAAYPPLGILLPGRTPSRISPQNLPVGLEAFDVSRSRWTEDIPPLSASQPRAYCSKSSAELNVKIVFGALEGVDEPSMRKAANTPSFMTRPVRERYGEDMMAVSLRAASRDRKGNVKSE
jgi:hypothetical protein